MRKLAFMGMLVLFAAAGCKKDDDTTTPTPVLTDLKVTSTLSGANAVPSNTSTATGKVEGTLDQESRILSLNISYSDSVATDSSSTDSTAGPFTPVAWKIYKGAATDSTGTEVFNLGTTFTSPYTFKDTLTADQVTDLKAGSYFLSIQTAKYPTGAIRGQLKAEE